MCWSPAVGGPLGEEDRPPGYDACAQLARHALLRLVEVRRPVLAEHGHLCYKIFKPFVSEKYLDTPGHLRQLPPRPSPAVPPPGQRWAWSLS